MIKVNQLTRILFLWLSFSAFLFLYAVQDARIDSIIQGSSLNVDSKVYLVSLLLLVIGWTSIYFTGRQKDGFIQWKALDVGLLVFVISLLITNCFSSKCCIIEGMKASKGDIVTLLALEGIALLSLPSMMYVFTWMRDEFTSRLLRDLNHILQGHKFFYGCVFIALACIILLVYFSFNSAIIMIDEPDTLAALSLDYTNLTDLTASDVHPPLYYYIAKLLSELLCSIFPSLKNIYAARLVSVIPFILMAALCVTVVRRRWGNYVAGMSLFALVAMPQMQFYGVCIRMYSWGMFWVTCCYLSAYSVMRHNRWRDWFVFVIVGLGAAWTHTFACIAAAPPYLFLAGWSINRGKKTICKWCVAAIITVVGFSPWLMVLVTQAVSVSKNGFWIKPVTWLDLYKTIMYPYLWFFVLLIFVGILSTTYYEEKKAYCRTKLKYAALGMLIPIFAIFVGYIYSVAISPILVERYITPAYGSMWIGCILAVHYLRIDRLRGIVTILLFLIGVNSTYIFASKQIWMRESAAKLTEHFNAIPSARFVATTVRGHTYGFYMLTKHDLLICKDELSRWTLCHGKRVKQIKSIGEEVRKYDGCLFYIACDENDCKLIENISIKEGFEIGKPEWWRTGAGRFAVFRLIKHTNPEIETVAKKLTSMRLDIKNCGTAENAVSIEVNDSKITQPAWAKNENGIGQVLESRELKQHITITAISDGKLRLAFRGADSRENGKRFPLWIDYKSIKIDGKEILGAPVATWHDKPFRYEMPVKDGQKITVEIEQAYHPYSREELKDVILKLNPKSSFISSHADEMVNEVLHIMNPEQKAEIPSGK